MHRFPYLSQNISEDKIVILDKEQIHHMKDVLRLKERDEVIVFDDKGNEYICFIKELINNEVILIIKGRQLSFKRGKKLNIAVACAIPKKSRLDEVVDKLTQLGVDRIIPLETKRVIISLDENKRNIRLKRWNRIALSASKQSQRNTLPTIEPVKSIEEVLSEQRDYDLKLMPTLSGRRKTLKQILAKSNNPKNILILIGPEGDFTEEEINLAKEVGFIPVSLGDLVLRVETAAIAMASFIRLYENR